MMVKQLSTIVSILLMLMPSGLFAQLPDTLLVKDKLAIREPSFDFGKIVQGKPVFHEFQVVNMSSAPLALENVQASCGCTTPEWSRESFAAGASTVIRVGYNAAVPGYFDKSITLMYAGGKTSMLNIKGTVWQAPDHPAPFNKSIAFLKTVKF